MKLYQYIDQLYETNELEEEALTYILDHIEEKDIPYLQQKALQTKEKFYGKKIYLRALIEFTNFCKRECQYCGINAYNQKVERYRLSKEEILETCEEGKRLGFHTFVLQGGEDSYFADEVLLDLVQTIKARYQNLHLLFRWGNVPMKVIKR